MSCRPSFTELVDWVEDRLPVERAKEVEAAFAAGDEDLLSAVGWIRAFHRDSALLPHQPVPDELETRLRDLFRDRHRAWDPTGYLQPDAVRDSRELPAASGFRASTQGGVVGARRVVVERGDVRLVLDVTEHNADGLEVTGSVQRTCPGSSAGPAAAAAAVVTFTSDGRLTRRIACSPDGSFHAAVVPEDVDEVWVDAGPDHRFRAEVRLTLH